MVKWRREPRSVHTTALYCIYYYECGITRFMRDTAKKSSDYLIPPTNLIRSVLRSPPLIYLVFRF